MDFSKYDDLPEAPPAMVAQTGVVLAQVTQTAIACPSQWDAWDAEGNYYYLRYRHGHGLAARYPDSRWHEDPLDDGWNKREVIADFTYGHPLDGSIGLEVFCALAGLRLAPGLMRTGLGDHFADELILNGIPEALAAALTEPWRALDEDKEDHGK